MKNPSTLLHLFFVCSLPSEFPSMDIIGPTGGKVIADLKSFLEERMNRRILLQDHLNSKHEQIRAQLVEVERENILSKQESSTLNAQLTQERNRVSVYKLFLYLLVKSQVSRNVIKYNSIYVSLFFILDSQSANKVWINGTPIINCTAPF